MHVRNTHTTCTNSASFESLLSYNITQLGVVFAADFKSAEISVSLALLYLSIHTRTLIYTVVLKIRDHR